MASPWLDKFRSGSFRGVEFKTDSHEFSRGRRKVEHEFPQRELSRSEDLGRQIGKFSLDMLVIGDDYFTQRDALLDALDKEGPGELIHPYLGRKVVQAGAYSLRETVGEGRMARITCDFSEAGQAIFPESTDDQAQSALDLAGNILDNSKTAFEKAFDLANSPSQVVSAASDRVNELADFMTDSVNKFTQPIENLTQSISNFKADIAALIRLPGELADRIKGIFEDLFNEFSGDEKTGSKVSGNFKDLSFPPVIGTTPSNEREQINQDAVANIGKEMAFATQASNDVNSEFISSREAVEARDGTILNIDDQLNNVTDDDLFGSLKDLQAALSKAIPEAGLADLITFTPKKTLPALVISHRLFQNVSKEDEIIDENGIQHPGFVPGNVEIEVSAVGQ